MNWIQLHLALNHVPVIGIPFVMILLAIGAGRKSNDVIRVAFWLITILSLMAIGIKFTGDFAFEQSPEQFSAVEGIVSKHEQAADQATTGVFLLGIAAALALFLARRGRTIRRWTLALVLVFGIATSLLYARSAHSGGQISHPELRN
jgi:hypothetical protein